MQSKVRPEKNDAHVASTPASMVALKACASASSIIFFWPDFSFVQSRVRIPNS